MADDLGYETLSCNGSTSYQTPNLDQLAQEGMRFTQCYATPLCTPSRVQIMTGKYNFRNYVGFGILDPKEKTFAHMLKERGYSTCVVGKWQLYGNKRQRELSGRTGSFPEQAGFDDYCLWQILEKAGPRYKHPFLELPGQKGKSFKGAYGPDMYVDYGLNFIQQHKDRPFFLYFPMALTHEPFQPTPDHPDYKHTTEKDTAYFAANVGYMDKLIGKMVDKLDELGLGEQTLILFVGDNGTDTHVISSVSEKRIRGDKGSPTVYGTHVPMIAYWPGTIKAGQVNDQLIDFTDFFPTLRQAADDQGKTTSIITERSLEEAPPNEVLDGLSFYDQLLRKPDAAMRRWVFCHYDPNWGNRPKRRYIHNQTWKLFENGEIYDMVNDPEHLRPLKKEALDKEDQYIISDLYAAMKSLK